jgi:beta-1,2-mannobiose phosphorylase / 1,2-beta-oligomannan phosphorylase
VNRLDTNPLVTPEDLAPTRDDLAVLCTLNPAAVRFADEVLLLVRVGEMPVDVPPDEIAAVICDNPAGEIEIRRFRRDDPDIEIPDPRTFSHRGRMLLTSLSHLRVARSTDGANFTFDPTPAIFPSAPYEAFGCEDPRITEIDGVYTITYTAVSADGVAVAMASTRDFVTFERHGLIFPPTQKDVCFFPEKVGGRYVCRHRPGGTEFNPPSIWTAYSPDLVHWGDHHVTLVPRENSWESARVGCGAPPIKTAEGWLEIYHGSDGDRYCLGAMLSDLEHPERLLTRSTTPVMVPEMPYELTGVFNECVFTNGQVVDPDGTITVYYGAADRICAAATTTIDDMLAAAKR